jgi:hypothetical protein
MAVERTTHKTERTQWNLGPWYVVKNTGVTPPYRILGPDDAHNIILSEVDLRILNEILHTIVVEQVKERLAEEQPELPFDGESE